MRRASKLFREEQRGKIHRAVVNAEAKTSCEIVPVVATASGRYDRAEDLVGVFLAVAAAIAVWLWFPRQAAESGSWGEVDASLFVQLLALAGSIVVAFVVGALAGSWIGSLRRLFIPRRQMLDEVAARSREIFFDQRVHHTQGAAGLLIYVSLFEHVAMVLGDQAILDKMGQPFLDRLCQQLTEAIRHGDVTDAICQTITQAAQELQEPLPRTRDDSDELDNVLVLID